MCKIFTIFGVWIRGYMRTNIEIDVELLNAGLDLSGLKTKKDLVNEALKEFVKMLRRKEMKSLRGKVAWEGDLEDMRTYGYE